MAWSEYDKAGIGSLGSLELGFADYNYGQCLINYITLSQKISH